VAAAVAVVLVLVGVYVPGSPIARERDEVDSASEAHQVKPGSHATQVYKQRYGRIEAADGWRSPTIGYAETIVPEEKETDEFIRLLQGAASRL